MSIIKDDFNTEYFRQIREEINIRVKLHYQLTVSKFAIGGYLFLFIQNNLSLASLSPYFVTASFLMLVDVALLENLGWIRGAGGFIRQKVENVDKDVIQWENSFAQAGGKWNCFTVPGYLTGVWIIAPVMVVAGFVYNIDVNDGKSLVLCAVSCYLLIYTFLLVLRNLRGS